MQHTMSNMLKLAQAKNVDAEEVAELVKNGYGALLDNWTIDDTQECPQEVEVVGTALVSTVMWMGGSGGVRCYTHDMVEVARDADGGLWITEEQENEYFC